MGTDRTLIDTSSEEHRHRCEVRWCIEKGAEWFRGYIVGVAQKRGEVAAARLRSDVRSQWAAGNTGQPGEWIEDAASR